jgi:hypothetical protein
VSDDVQRAAIGLARRIRLVDGPDLVLHAAGRSARFEYIARISNVDAAGVERADVHASTVRLKTGD